MYFHVDKFFACLLHPLFIPVCSSMRAQIPKSSDPLTGVEGVNVRDAFAASKSFTLMAADYSQIEVW